MPDFRCLLTRKKTKQPIVVQHRIVHGSRLSTEKWTRTLTWYQGYTRAD